MSDVEPIAWFSQLDKSLVDIAGGKGANLGELVRTGFPVPPGFVVTAPAYLDAMDAAGVRGRLSDLAADCGIPGSRTRPAELQALIRSAGMPPALRAAIVEAYAALGDEPFVAVRSSATAEDTASTSFAGMNETYTNVRGPDRLIARVIDCWASLFGPRVCAYRAMRQIADEPAIAVVVQRMVDAERSGVMFTVDPASGRAIASSSKDRSASARSWSEGRSNPTPTLSTRRDRR